MECIFRYALCQVGAGRTRLDNPRYAHANIAPGHWGGVPAYSYVTYRKLKSIPADAQYFHAQWRQQTLLLGKDDYEVVRASGVGQLIGWNVTLRMPNGQTAPLDENEVIHVDGAAILPPTSSGRG